MMMEEPLFDELRTKQQLGYCVSCSLRDTFGILGFTVTVNTQGDKHNVYEVDDKIEEFLQNFCDMLTSEKGEDDFDNVREALIKVKQCVDNHLEEEVIRNWAEITSMSYIFDRMEREVKCLQDISVTDVQKWLEHHISSGRENFRKLSIQVVASQDSVCDGVTKELQDEPTNARDSNGYCQGDYSFRYIGDGNPNTEPLMQRQMSGVISHCIGCKTGNGQKDKCDASCNHFITSIEAFKNELNIYPITKMDLSS
ncbi:hypothetical protein J437_LFUL018636 [Ladona fulva]|uniref:Coenzyme PQQ synthesis protein F-like C-terminal lobe domain-containing protein n=1 Tax=Ladona fulva TaxID=123851 RepID=A0A8K0KQY0_LADFU|nr:hypothetical protein J437_LFUL018636 [Ladona fulva]